MAASAQIPQEQQRGSSGNKGIFSRCVCFTQQHTTVFEGAPRQILPSAVLLGDVDNDPKGDIELVVGGADGTLAVFKAGHPTPGPYLEASGGLRPSVTVAFAGGSCTYHTSTSVQCGFVLSIPNINRARVRCGCC